MQSVSVYAINRPQYIIALVEHSGVCLRVTCFDRVSLESLKHRYEEGSCLSRSSTSHCHNILAIQNQRNALKATKLTTTQSSCQAILFLTDLSLNGCWDPVPFPHHTSEHWMTQTCMDTQIKTNQIIFEIFSNYQIQFKHTTG